MSGRTIYSYVGGNPVSLVDPTGEFAITLGLKGLQALAQALGAVTSAGIGAAISNAMSGNEADTPEMKADRDAYHGTCDEQPPPNLDFCDEIRWKIGRAKRCVDMRRGYMSKWNDTYQGHYNQISMREAELTKLEKILAEKCCGK